MSAVDVADAEKTLPRAPTAVARWCLEASFMGASVTGRPWKSVELGGRAQCTCSRGQRQASPVPSAALAVAALAVVALAVAELAAAALAVAAAAVAAAVGSEP